MSDDNDKFGLLVIGDPTALAGLAKTGQLDLLLGYRHIVIPDETAYEANRRFAALPAVDDPGRLQRWIYEQIAAGRVSCPTTWIGELAAHNRRVGTHRESTGMDKLAATLYLSHRDRADDHGLVTLLIDDSYRHYGSEEDNSESVGIKALLARLGHPVD